MRSAGASNGTAAPRGRRWPNQLRMISVFSQRPMSLRGQCPPAVIAENREHFGSGVPASGLRAVCRMFIRYLGRRWWRCADRTSETGAVHISAPAFGSAVRPCAIAPAIAARRASRRRFPDCRTPPLCSSSPRSFHRACCWRSVRWKVAGPIRLTGRDQPLAVDDEPAVARATTLRRRRRRSPGSRPQQAAGNQSIDVGCFQVEPALPSGCICQSRRGLRSLRQRALCGDVPVAPARADRRLAVGGRAVSLGGPVRGPTLQRARHAGVGYRRRRHACAVGDTNDACGCHALADDRTVRAGRCARLGRGTSRRTATGLPRRPPPCRHARALKGRRLFQF